ncbi:MAG: ABC transporter permease subunit, partial [Desulfobacteraceae bacterium]
VALYVGFLAVGIGLGVGGILGLISGYFGGYTDAIIMRICDVIMSFPWLLLVIVVVSILGTGLTNAMLAISVTLIPRYARLIRSSEDFKSSEMASLISE